MASTLAIAVSALVIYWIYSNVSGLLKNVAAAKRSGLPYIVTPLSIYNRVWLLTRQLWMPILRRLPLYSDDALDLLGPDWQWELLFEPFKKYGDIFLTVSPGMVYVWNANAEANHQITGRREAFPKPLETYGILDIFGRNLVTTEGIEWKEHRKVSAPNFNEKNNVLVFAEACQQAQGMLRKWTSGGHGSPTITEAQDDVQKLTLHIISSIGFGVRILWPGEEHGSKMSAQQAIYCSNEPPKGHTMSFADALTIMIKHLIIVLITPKLILKHLPFKKTKIAYESYVNWRDYMNELFAQKIEEAKEGKQAEGMDIMGALVKSAYGTEATNNQKPSPSRAEKGDACRPVLSDSDILGNAFVMIVAGHETTASSLHFSIVELAMSPISQKLVQKEVESIFGDKPPKTWDYESSINRLLGGAIGAVMNEELRLMPPVVTIPKSVTKHQDQIITVDGKKIILPAGAYVALDSVGVHRNPKYWPTQSSRITNKSDDLNDFRPERWLVKGNAEDKKTIDTPTDTDEEDDLGGFTGRDSHAQLFRPVRGSYIPFSDGARSCLGRRLAQVKVVAVLATIFQKYSIELAVDEWATDEEVVKMTTEQRKMVYQKAKDKARQTLRGATSILTLGLHPGFVPLRAVRKGEERFINIVD